MPIKDANISEENGLWEILAFLEQLLKYYFVSITKPLFNSSVNNVLAWEQALFFSGERIGAGKKEPACKPPFLNSAMHCVLQIRTILTARVKTPTKVINVASQKLPRKFVNDIPLWSTGNGEKWSHRQ